jgi:hypothetical protein
MLLKGAEGTEFFVAVFTPNLPFNNRKEMKKSIAIGYRMTDVYNIILVEEPVDPLFRSYGKKFPLSALLAVSAAAAHYFRQAIRPKMPQIQK